MQFFYCADQSLLKHLAIAENLVRKHFTTAHGIHLSLEYDPEIHEGWVVLNVQTPGEIEEVIEKEDSFIEDWISEVPFPESEKIRLSCDII